jgi:hypothetical protein
MRESSPALALDLGLRRDDEEKVMGKRKPSLQSAPFRHPIQSPVQAARDSAPQRPIIERIAKGETMARHLLTAATILLAAGLAGCGDKTANGGNAAGSSAAGGSGASAKWNAADACSILDKADVAAALKQDVKETQLGLVHEAGTADAATSECSYIGADGSSLARLMTRWSPINDNTQASMDGARNAAAAALKAFSDKPIEDVPGLGKAAFLTPGIDSLTVFLDEARMITLTVDKVPDGASGKDIAIALAKKAGG